MAETEEELRVSWRRWERKSEKVGLKLNIQKTKITTEWIDGGKVEMVSDFIFWGSKFNVNGDFNHEIKTLAPWKKSYDQPRQHIKKQRPQLANKGPYG